MKIKKLARFILAPLKRQYGIVRLKLAARKPELKIVVGASGIYNKGWIPTESNYLNLLSEKDFRFFFKENTLKAILAEHVWEHLSEEDGYLAAKLCYLFLKPGGYLRIAVPDGYQPDSNYIAYVKPGGTGSGADDHKVLYTYNSLAKMLEEAGFKVQLLEFFNEKGIFHERPWAPEDGFIHRSKKFDPRNKGENLFYTSLILDAIKS